MIVVIEPHNYYKYSHLIDQMFRLRARVFRDRLGWDVQVADGKERDKYDDENPVYIIYTDVARQEVKGSLRLLPTTGPTLLAEFFSDTLPEAANLSAPTIWEGTRFCLNEKALVGRQREGLFFASAVLIAALGDVAVRGGIESIVGNFDSSMLRLYRRVGCEVEILGATSRFGRPVYLGLFPVSEPALRLLKRRLENVRSTFTRTSEMAA